ncbi:MAG: calcium-binding protein, partial [Paracoccaceae bacterium]
MALIFGSNNADSLGSLNTDDTIFGLGGNDTLDGAGGADVLYGGDGNDQIFGGTGTDVLYGGDGNDTLVNEAGSASLYGGVGNDTLQGSGSGAVERLEGGDGNDTFRLSTPGGDYTNDLHLGGIGFDRQLFLATTDGQSFDTDGLEVNSIEEIEFAAIGIGKDVTVT